MIVVIVTGEDSRSLMEWVHKYSAAHASRFRLVEVLGNQPGEIDAYKTRGGTLGKFPVPDPDAAFTDFYKVGMIPSLYVYGRDGEFVELLEPPFKSYDDVARRLDKYQD